MYSVVLMMALGSGAGAPVWDNSGAEYIARYGDHGHKEYRCFGGRGNCHGGGCYGGGYYGGCHGGGGYGGCCGGGGCYGGCCGGGGYGSYGGMGYAGGYYSYSPYATTTGYYSYAPSGGTIYSAGNMPSDYQYGVPLDQGARYSTAGGTEQIGSPQDQRQATLRVRLPADAKLTFDGSPTVSTNSVRMFTTPPLQPNKDYKYTLRAQVTRDGKKIERTKEVTVRPGQQTEVTFDLPDENNPSK